ncbi:hypothetical protein PPN31119_00866 [Pandoraea pnomenusa]|jgi:hypothetical protein|uniref:Uncharacterized protein n=1 Tax=Pandoraea pnomenusa TaxID=93220 RepID=A0A378YE66_9BURK|nr:Uncharacterised protein [Pandoraea pnomenusa]VVE62470.1 hypothetical protein PPN31119_00866 [Pandoraea pnomenusa]
MRDCIDVTFNAPDLRAPRPAASATDWEVAC